MGAFLLCERMIYVKKIAVVSAILEDPATNQEEFNKIVSDFGHIVYGRMGIPFTEAKMAVVSITVVGELDVINNFTGKLGNIHNVLVKTAISKKEI